MNVFDVIVQMVPTGSTVLDLGCDDCTLLERLHEERRVMGRGVDIDDRSIQECIRKGISVFHGTWTRASRTIQAAATTTSS